MKRMMLVLSLISVTALNADTNTLDEVVHTVSNALQILKTQAGTHELKLMEGELLCFEMGFNTNESYRAFTPIITNNWQQIVPNINRISTNYVDRLLILGTGKQGDEALYLHYYEALARMKISNEIESNDLDSFSATTREDLHTLLRRRYNEPSVSNLIELLRIADPDTVHWDSVVSGEAYQQYLEMTGEE